MSSAPGKRHHIRTSTNISDKLHELAWSHPFPQQVDIVFPSCERLESLLATFTTRYCKGKANLAELFSAGPTFVRPYASNTAVSQIDNDGALIAVSDSGRDKSDSDEVYPHQNPRGVLTLCVSKETYQRLGLIGRELPFKNRAGERYVIELPLHQNADSPTNQTRRLKALESWDTLRASENGIGGTNLSSSTANAGGMWDVVYCAMDTSDLDKLASDVSISDPIAREVLCERAYLRDIWVPNPLSLLPQPRQQNSDEWEDWNREVAAVFEWIGMVGLRAQRLQANDRVDPYVAIYDPPPSNKVGNVTHLRWRGFLSPSFVQSLIDASVEFLKAQEQTSTSERAPPPPAPFLAIVVHGIANSPVVYLPRYSGRRAESSSCSPPAHLPRSDGEDTWSLLLLPPDSHHRHIKSIFVESIGQWDARWG